MHEAEQAAVLRLYEAYLLAEEASSTQIVAKYSRLPVRFRLDEKWTRQGSVRLEKDKQGKPLAYRVDINQKMHWGPIRFTLWHEVAHIVIGLEDFPFKWHEPFCDAFAAAVVVLRNGRRLIHDGNWCAYFEAALAAKSRNMFAAFMIVRGLQLSVTRKQTFKRHHLEEMYRWLMDDAWHEMHGYVPFYDEVRSLPARLPPL